MLNSFPLDSDGGGLLGGLLDHRRLLLMAQLAERLLVHSIALPRAQRARPHRRAAPAAHGRQPTRRLPLRVQHSRPRDEREAANTLYCEHAHKGALLSAQTYRQAPTITAINFTAL